MDDGEEGPLEEVPSGDGEGPGEAEISPREHTWLESLEGVEEGDALGMKLFKFFVPFAIPAAIFAILYTVVEYGRWLQLGTLAILYLIPPAGKESIIPSGVALDFSAWTMAGLILMVDVVCALFISWNFPLAKKIPLVGRYIGFIERTGAKLMKGNPALRAGAWFGLVLFVMIPFQGSGGITSSIIGRAVGMRTSYIVTAVAVGAITAGLLIGFAAELGVEALRYDLATGVILIMLGILAALTAVLAYRIWRIRKWEEMDRADR